MKNPIGYVEMPSYEVHRRALAVRAEIKRQREENKQEGIREVMYDVPFKWFREVFKLPIRPLSEEQCIKKLKERNHRFWWYYNVSHYMDERLEQMEKLIACTQVNSLVTVLVNVDVAAILNLVESE